MKRIPIPAQRIEHAILLLRGHKVLLDTELATLYGVETRVLVQAVKRNLARFPQDFMFQLDAAEIEALRSQSVISNAPGRGGRRYAPYVFTEQGVAMRLDELETRIERKLSTHDQAIAGILDAIRQLMAPPREPKRRRIGFVRDED